MTKDVSANKQNHIEGWYREVHKWVSEMHFAQDEMVFVKKLLNSDVFEPNTPNLFERIQEYLGSLGSFETELKVFESDLLQHENELGAFLELLEPTAPDLERKQLELADRLNKITGRFRMLKSEIFQYTGGVLRKKR